MEMAAARNYFMLYPNFEKQHSFSTSHSEIGAGSEAEMKVGADVKAKAEAEPGPEARVKADDSHTFAVPLFDGDNFGRDILDLLPSHRLPPIHTLVQLDVFNEVIYDYENLNLNNGESDLRDRAGNVNAGEFGGSVGGGGSRRRTLHTWVRRSQEHSMCNATSKYFDRFVMSMSTIPPRLENMNVHDAMVQALKQVWCGIHPPLAQPQPCISITDWPS